MVEMQARGNDSSKTKTAVDARYWFSGEDCEGSQRQGGAVSILLKDGKKDKWPGWGNNPRRIEKLCFELTGCGKSCVGNDPTSTVKEVGQNID